MATKKEIDLADFDLPKMTMDMYLQSERLKTFKDWPFHDNCNCTAEMVWNFFVGQLIGLAHTLQPFTFSYIKG